MSVRRQYVATAVAMTALTSFFACGGMRDSGTGSETNWLTGCATDDDCSAGSCRCSICTASCDDDDPCSGDPTRVACARPGSAAFDTVCGSASEVPGGVCLSRCANDGDCAGGTRCSDGTCVPIRRADARGGAVGDFCAPEDELVRTFASYSAGEVNVQRRSPACQTHLCIAAHFQGRVSCPYGQDDPRDPDCVTPAGEPVTTVVPPQLVARPPEDALYCSCRCDGPPEQAPFCACPAGFECRELISITPTMEDDLLGSYCVKAGTYVEDPRTLMAGERCDRAVGNCDDR